MSDSDRDDARIRHPLTHDTWVLDGRTGRTKYVERAREEGARILAEARADYPDDPDYVAAQRLAPCSLVPDTFTHERIAAALAAARHEEREEWRSRLASQCGQTLAARHERDEARHKEREACARHIEALALAIRDYGPTTPEGLLTALGGAQVGALMDAALSLRSCAGAPPQLSAQTGGVGGSRPGKPIASTAEMRARIRELATGDRDDFDRAVLLLLDDFERLLAFYEAARAGPRAAL